jgi:hypothetical protein
MNFNAEFYKFSFTEKNFSKENVLQQYVPQYNLSSEPNSLQKFNSFLKYLRTSLVFN